MAEYIEREAVLKHTTTVEIGAFSEWDVVKVEHIKNIPSADVVEVVHGKWMETMQPLGFEEVKCATCSVCNEDWIMDEDVCIDDYKTHWKYCPVCGAKMDGERRCEE